MNTPSQTRRWSSIVGVVMALGWPFAFMWMNRGQSHLADPSQDIAAIEREWAVSALLLGIMLLWERQPLSSVGVKAPKWADIGWMLLMVVATFVGNSIVIGLIVHASPGRPVPGAAEMAGVIALPIALRVALALTAAICEEFISRGYAIERLTSLTGSKIVGAVVPCIAFTLAHIRLYGFGVGLLPVLVTSIVATLLYVWRRNLIVNMAMHAVIDLFGLIVQPVVHPHP
jgi:membrane protease YdiL (CAAX protease family)